MKGWVLLRAEWERVLGVLLITVGGVGLLLGYRGVAESVFVGQQLAYVVSGGLGGVFLGAVGVGMLVSADLHDEWRKLDRIESAIRGDIVADASDLLGQADPPSTGADSDRSETRPRSSLRVTAFSRISLPPRSSYQPMALAIDWDGDHLRRPLTGALATVLLTAGVIATGWNGAARSTSAIDGFRPVVVAGMALAVGVLAASVYPLWLRIRLTQRKRLVLRGWLRRTQDDDLCRLRGGSAASTPAGPFVVAEGLHRFHVASCPTLKGLAARPMDAESTAGALPPCRVCQPA
jgi:hypothetical protein